MRRFLRSFLAWRGPLGRKPFIVGMLVTVLLQGIVGVLLPLAYQVPPLGLLLLPVQASVVYRLIVLPMRRGVDAGLPPVILIPAYLLLAYACYAWDLYGDPAAHVAQTVFQVCFVVALANLPSGRARSRLRRSVTPEAVNDR